MSTIISVNPSAESGRPISSCATFEHRDPSENFVHVVSESGFFSSTNPNSRVVPTDSNITFRLLRSHLDACVRKGAKINSDLHQDEILQLFENFVNLNELRFVPRFAIASLPEIKITEGYLALGEANCHICLEDFKIGEEAMELPCKHFYHKECTTRWLNRRNSCPVCRFKLKIYDPIYGRLRKAWNPQALVSGTAGGEMLGSSSSSMATRFRIELLWPIESSFSKLEICSSTDESGEGNSEDSGDYESSGSVEQDSDHDWVF